MVEDERLSYTYEPVADGIIGKIDLPGFYDNGGSLSVERDLRNALRDLKSKGTLKGLVLDMRQNTGGFLNQAVKVAGMFLTGGVVVISRYFDGEMNYSRDIDGRLGLLLRSDLVRPLIVLLLVTAVSACDNSVEESYKAGHRDGYVVGYDTACKRPVREIYSHFDDQTYSRGYANGILEGQMDCNNGIHK